MKKVIVIGCPGSGKSTLSTRLAKLTGFSLFHLDNMYWNPDRTNVSCDVFDARLKEAMSNDEWIIDGNYQRTLEPRLMACDTVLFLDYPTEICLNGIKERFGKPRADMPWIEKEGEEYEEFLAYVKSYNEKYRPDVLNLLASHLEKNIIIFRDRTETEQFLLSLKTVKRICFYE